jgi:hypothetical protein
MGITIHYLLISKSKKQVEKALNIAKFLAKKLGYEYIEYKEEGFVDITWSSIALSGYISYQDPRKEWKRNIRNSLVWLKKIYGVEPMKVNKRISIHELDRPKGVYYYTKDYAETITKDFKFTTVYTDIFVYGYIWFIREERVKNKNEAYPSIKTGIEINTETTETFNIGFFKFKKYYICDESCKTQPFSDNELMPNIKHHINFVNILEAIEPLMYYSSIRDEGGYYKTHDINKLIEKFGYIKNMIWNFAFQLSEISNLPITIGGKYIINKNDHPS